jgi:hypothetical protein
MSQNNYAFIDSQNLFLATTTSEDPWKIDLRKFRAYLKEKYRVSRAYYFFGAFDIKQQDMYANIQDYGYITIFREHNTLSTGKKKGNVDTDIVFSVMKSICEQEDFDKVVLVSGDGDYKRMVDWLIAKDRFKMMLLPCKKYASSLYKSISRQYYAYLDEPGMRVKFGLPKDNMSRTLKAPYSYSLVD